MKTKFVFLSLLLVVSLMSSCNPIEIAEDSEMQNLPTVYGTGGEHSVEPDNEKDG